MDAGAEVATWRCQVLDVRCLEDLRPSRYGESWVLERGGATSASLFRSYFQTKFLLIKNILYKFKLISFYFNACYCYPAVLV